jgi:GTP cyclohydrolase I
MNVHSPKSQSIPARTHAKDALKVLRQWAESATETEIFELDPSIANLIPGRIKP